MLPFHHMVVQTIFHIAAVHLVTDKNTNQLNLIQCNGKLVKKKKYMYIYINIMRGKNDATTYPNKPVSGYVVASFFPLIIFIYIIYIYLKVGQINKTTFLWLWVSRLRDHQTKSGVKKKKKYIYIYIIYIYIYLKVGQIHKT